jgi:hypothetical protein
VREPTLPIRIVRASPGEHDVSRRLTSGDLVKPRLALAFTVLALLTVAVACGDDDDSPPPTTVAAPGTTTNRGDQATETTDAP